MADVEGVMMTEEGIAAEWEGQLAVREWSPRARARADSTCLLTKASIAVIKEAKVTVGVAVPAVDSTAVEMAVVVAVEDVPVKVAILLWRDALTIREQ